MKVGCIFGRNGEAVKKLCAETGARVNVLHGSLTSAHRIVVISSQEQLDAVLSPAMVAVTRLSRRINELPEGDEDGIIESCTVFCCVRLLVPSGQAYSLIGRQGSTVKSMQEASGTAIQVFSRDEVPACIIDSDEKVVELKGEAMNVIKALESVVGHLRKFLVDQSVLPLFEKNTDNADKMMLNPTTQAGFDGSEYSLPVKRDMLYVDLKRNHDTVSSLSGWPYYGQAANKLPGISSSELGPNIATQVAQTTQIPLMYANEIVGVNGSNIAYIQHYSGAIVTVQESQGLPDEITIQIKGTPSEVRVAHQLIQECMSRQDEELLARSYGNAESVWRSFYPQPDDLGMQYPYESSGL